MFLANMVDFYDKIFFPALIENNIKLCLILGDTFDRRKYLNLYTLHVAKQKFFDRFRDLGIEVKILYGNHDTFFRNTNEVNSIDFIAAEYPNMEVISKPKVFDFDGLKVGMISWIHSAAFEESIEFIRTVQCDILMGHFEISTFEMVKGAFCEHGLDKTLFDRFDQVYSGHFHVVSTDGRISYLSNPNETNWGDYGLSKGAWILDTATRERARIEKTINLFEKITYTDDLELLEFDFDKYAGKIVRVYTTAFGVENKSKMGIFLDKLATKAHSVDLQETGGLDSDEVGDVADLEETTTKAVISQYVDTYTAGSTFDKAVLMAYFDDVLSEAQEKTTSG